MPSGRSRYGIGMRLYTFLHSPNALKVRLALAELGLAYDPIEVDLFRGEQRAEAFARLNPHRKVPVLEDGPLVLRESNAIIAYLGRTHGTTRWPDVPTSEARALQWLFFDSAHLTPHCGVVWWTHVVAPRTGFPAPDEAVLKRALDEVTRSLDLLEAELDERQYLLKSSMSLADCAMAAALAMLRGSPLDDAERWPNVVAYRERLRGRDSWAEARGDAISELG
ncbi:glutathione S-transferase family protein [Sorangium sp. So ce315]|uniref:glutathione S-transferase family protein n=1 Tax=Sorangium sp. So ce315 TaxID=3133299 RepID=UPI003F62A179